MKKLVTRIAIACVALILIGTLMTVGYGSRRQTPPAEVDLDTVELDIDFGDEFIPFDDEFSIDIGG